MTVTVYTFSFEGPEGRFYGSIAWAKETPWKLQAKLCKHITAVEVDTPVWTAMANHDDRGFAALVRKTKLMATKMGLTLVSEAATKYKRSV